MICMLFGHRDAPCEIKSVLKEKILEIYTKHHEVEFYIGNNGAFDALAQRCLNEVNTDGVEIEYSIILSRVDEVALCKNNSKTLYPDGQEKALRKYAISKRNDWMIKKADIAICYVSNRFTNCYKMLERLRRKGVHIINISDLVL
ncbi:MAG: hypothetical protein IKC87_06815 [Clostridia bacterium]|nr:hypothetical protein [Clostridia bacterium]